MLITHKIAILKMFCLLNPNFSASMSLFTTLINFLNHFILPIATPIQPRVSPIAKAPLQIIVGYNIDLTFPTLELLKNAGTILGNFIIPSIIIKKIIR